MMLEQRDIYMEKGKLNTDLKCFTKIKNKP